MQQQKLCTLQLENLTYPLPRLRDFTLDDNLPALKLPPDSDRVRNSPEVDLGILDALPVELLRVLLSQLDLRTLEEFRLVNRRAIEVLESIPQYKAIINYACNALRGILSIETGRWISCENLYEKLCAAECEQCGDFGGYLYILTCERLCFLCLSEEKRYLPLRYSNAIRKFGITHQIIDKLPHMKSISGTYSPNEKKCREQLALVDCESAYCAGIALHGSLKAMEQYVSDKAAQRLQEYNKRASRAKIEGSMSGIRRIRRPQTEDVFDGRSGNPMRFMAIVRTPWLNRVSQELEWGFHCVGCRKSYCTRPLHYRRKFTVASFGEHLRREGSIKNGLHCID